MNISPMKKENRRAKKMRLNSEEHLRCKAFLQRKPVTDTIHQKEGNLNRMCSILTESITVRKGRGSIAVGKNEKRKETAVDISTKRIKGDQPEKRVRPDLFLQVVKALT